MYAWALIPNRFCLYLRTPQSNLSVGMHNLNSGCAAWFNKCDLLVGSLFQGWFKAIFVEDDSHTWELSRYVHLNFVWKNIVVRPEHEKWNSYRYYCDTDLAPG